MIQPSFRFANALRAGLGAIFVWALLAYGSPPAGSADEATAAVVRLYAAVAKDKDSFESAAIRGRFFTRGFAAVLNSIDRREVASNSAILDFDPILDTNADFPATDLAVKAATPDLVVATFGKGSNRRSVAYRMAREGGEWRVDDIQSAPGAKGVQKFSVRKISDDDLKASPSAR